MPTIPQTQPTKENARTFTSDRLWDLRNEIVYFQWQCRDVEAVDATFALLEHVESQWREAIRYENREE